MSNINFKYKKELEEKTKMLSQVEKISKFGTWSYNIKSDNLVWSSGVFQIHDLDISFHQQPTVNQAINFYIEPERERIQNIINSSIEYKEDFKFESIIRTRCGSIKYIQAYGSIGLDHEGNVETLYGVCQDVTDARLTEEVLKSYQYKLEEIVDKRTTELKRAQVELLKREKLAVIGKLLAIVAHELRNPLGTIRNAVYEIQQRVDDQLITDDIIEKAVERVSRNIDRCDSIVEELMMYVRSSKPEISKVNLHALIKVMISDMHINPNVQIYNGIDPSLMIKVDPVRLQRVYINLINNSIEAILDDDFGPGIGHIKLSSTITDENLILEIYDNGPGIEKKDLKRVMEPLVSTKSFGVGLGLSIVRQVVEEHKGSVEIQSEHNHYTKILIYFPKSILA